MCWNRVEMVKTLGGGVSMEWGVPTPHARHRDQKLFICLLTEKKNFGPCDVSKNIESKNEQNLISE